MNRHAPENSTPPRRSSRRSRWLALALGAGVAGVCGLWPAAALAAPSGPTVQFTAGTPAPAWVTGSRSVTATASTNDPGDPITAVSCQLDSGSWTTNAGSALTVWVPDVDGVHTIACYATTRLAVHSPTVSEHVQVDDQTPTVVLSGAAVAPLWDSGAQTVTATASEAQVLGGIASVTCATGAATSSTPGAVGSITVSGDGEHVVRCWAQSAAGVQSQIVSETVQIDSTAPTVTFGAGASASRWFSTAQTVSVHASVPSGLAVLAAVDCTIDGVRSSYPASAGAVGESVAVTVAPPGGALSCRASDSAGNTSAVVVDQVQIDDTPPTGQFVPDLADPTDVQAVVSDSQSGVAGVVLELEQPGRGWATLPTSFDRLTGLATAQIPASMMSAGTSLLEAVVTDTAGNSAMLTTNQDGSPALVTLPLHAHPTLMERLARVPLASHHRRHRRHPGSRGARHYRAPRPIAPGFVPRLHGIRLLYGQHAQLVGYLRTAAGLPLAGYVLDVVQTVYGTGRPEVLGTVTTNRAGEYSYRIPYGPARTVSVRWPGNLLLAPRTLTRSVRTVDAATLNISKTAFQRTLTLTGRTRGGYVPARGLQVNFWWRVGCCDRWHFLGKTSTDAAGRYRGVLHLPARLGHLPIEIRSSVPGRGLWPWLRAFSPALLVRF